MLYPLERRKKVSLHKEPRVFLEGGVWDSNPYFLRKLEKGGGVEWDDFAQEMWSQ